MSVQFPGRGTFPANGTTPSDLLKTVAILCQAFQDNVPLLSSLREICGLLGSDVASICRIDLKTPLNTPQVLSCNVQPKMFDADHDIDFAIAPYTCGKNICRAKFGSVWFGEIDDAEENETLFRYLLQRRLSESASILLERKNGTADFLELHFCHPISSKMANMLEVLGPILSDIWKKRVLGKFTEAKMTDLRRKPVAKKQANILSIENPCQLSRSEYRVCLLLARGLNNTALLHELSITMSTLRTHFRNIYVKTGTKSQPELIHDLLASTVYDQSASSDQTHVA